MEQMTWVESSRRIAVNRAVLDMALLLESRAGTKGERAEALWIGQQLRGRVLGLEVQPAKATSACLAA